MTRRTTSPNRSLDLIDEDELFQVKNWVNRGGPFYLKTSVKEDNKGRIKKVIRARIKTNERFRACEIDVPEAFRDNIKLLDGEISMTEAVHKSKTLERKVTYTVESRGGGWYNVVDGQGKIVNDKALKAEDAKQLKEELEK